MAECIDVKAKGQVLSMFEKPMLVIPKQLLTRYEDSDPVHTPQKRPKRSSESPLQGPSVLSSSVLPCPGVP